MNYNFTINAKTFADALASCLRVIPNKAPINILECFKLELLNDKLRITASSPENSVFMMIEPTAIEGQGAICVNARKFTDLFKRLEGDANVSVDGTSITIKTASGKYEMQGIEASNFPATDGIENPILSTTFATETFINGIDSVLYATGTDEYRQIMCGVHVDIDNDSLVFVATDTRKLATSTHKLAEPLESPAEFTIPTFASSLIRTLFAKEPTITITLSENKVIFGNERVRFCATLLNGNYPNWRRVIPQDNAIKVNVSRNELRSAINRVSGFADNTNLLRLQFGLGVISLNAKDEGMAQYASEHVSCDSATDITIGFSSEHLLLVLNNLSADSIEIAMKDGGRPAIFTCGGAEMALLMPMSLN